MESLRTRHVYAIIKGIANGGDRLRYKIGEVLQGKISGIQPYGAFVTLDEETQGLIHISEIRHGYVSKIDDYVKVDEMVDVMVLDIDEYSQQISLSLRALQETTYHPFSNRRYIKRYGRRTGRGFETIHDSMPSWIEETLNDLSQ